jgi:hypothetical protein
MNSPILTPEARHTPKFTHWEGLGGDIFDAQLMELASKHKPTLTGTGIAVAALLAQRTVQGATALLEPPESRVRANCRRPYAESDIGFGRRG